MKSINILLLSFVIISIIILGCDRNKNPEKILSRSDELTSRVESSTFAYIFVYEKSGNVKQDSYKCFAKRGRDNEDEEILMLRVESGNGKVVTYDGDTYRELDPEKKEVFVVTRRYNPAKYARKFLKVVKMVMTKKSDGDDGKANDDVVITFDGTARVDGILCDIISKSGPAFDENSSVSELFYIGIEHGIVRKKLLTLYANGLKIQFNKSIVKDIKTNIELHDSLFTLSIPKDYKLDKYSPPTSSDSRETAELLGIGGAAPNWTLVDGNGDSLSLSDMIGRPVVLDFWGTWCGWCVVAMPKIQDVYAKYEKYGAEVLGISCREPEGADPVNFMADRGIKYKVLLNGDSVAAEYKVRGYPTLYVVGSDGKIVFADAGYRDDIDSVLSIIIEADPVIAVQLDTIPSSAGAVQ